MRGRTFESRPAFRRAAGAATFGALALTGWMALGSVWAGEPPASGAPAPTPPPSAEPKTTTQTLHLFEDRQVEITLPPGWTGSEQSDPPNGVPTFDIADPGDTIELLLSFVPDPEGRWAARPGLEAQLRSNLQGFLEGAVEKEVQPTFFDAADGLGVYATLTDKSFTPSPTSVGERHYATSGLRSWKGMGMMFTLLSNSLDSATDRQALEIVRTGIRQTRGPQPGAAGDPSAAPLAGPDPRRAPGAAPQFSLPTAPWSLVLPEKVGLRLHLEEREIQPDGSGAYFLLADEKLGFVVSFWIEPLGECRTSRACRDFVWKGLLPKLAPMKPENVALTEVGEVSIAEYLLTSFEGKPVRQQNWIAELVQDDFWVDMHLSKTDYEPKDRGLFVAFLRGIQFAPKRPTPPPQP